MYTHKEPGISVFDFFREEFNHEEDNGAYGKVLDCAVKNLCTAYLAYEVRNVHGNHEVTAVVCLLHYSRDPYYNFGYKEIPEIFEPVECNCPERILKLLTPLLDPTGQECAQRWREKCWENIERRKAMPRLKKGMVIEFAQPIYFNSGEEKVFIVDDLRKLVFRDKFGWRYKLSRSTLQQSEWRVVS